MTVIQTVLAIMVWRCVDRHIATASPVNQVYVVGIQKALAQIVTVEAGLILGTLGLVDQIRTVKMIGIMELAVLRLEQ